MNQRLVYQALSDLARRIEALQPDETVDQVKRLSREVYKSNTLAETQAETTRAALERLEAGQPDAAQQAKLALIEAMFPVLDSIEAGIVTGMQQTKALAASSPQAARTLYAWLKGQRLLRQRLLDVFAAEGVRPIPTVGHPFDPHQHIAVKTVTQPDQPDDVIAAEERPGYTYAGRVLRFADVVVNKREEPS